MNYGNGGRRSQQRSLGKRDRSILTDVVRYRLTTNEFIRQRYLPEASPAAISKITSRLVAGGWLNHYRLFDNRYYFVPGKRLAAQLGLPNSRCRPLGPQSLATNISVAAYCHRSGRCFTLLDAKDYQKSWSWIPTKFRVLPAVAELGSGPANLRNVRVDLGGTPTHVASKSLRDVTIRSQLPGYQVLLQNRQFVEVVLTTTIEKKELLMKALTKHSWPVNTRLEVFIVPELSQLITE